MPWIIEVLRSCPKCGGSGVIGDPVNPAEGGCPTCHGDRMVWLGVHGKGKPIYSYQTKREASEMMRICYRESIRDWRLGADATVRVREVDVVPTVGVPGPKNNVRPKEERGEEDESLYCAGLEKGSWCHTEGGDDE